MLLGFSIMEKDDQDGAWGQWLSIIQTKAFLSYLILGLFMHYNDQNKFLTYIPPEQTESLLTNQI